MNKETRIFVWGLILLVICGTGMMIHVTQMINKTWDSTVYNWILFALTTIGTIMGSVKISKTT